MVPVGQSISKFSHDGKFFAQLTDQGILQIWDTESNKLAQEYKPNLHLAGACTALTWVLVATQNEKNIVNDDGAGHTRAHLLALANAKGQVSLYSYTHSQVVSQLKGDGHVGTITAITKDNKGNLYTCGEDCQVVVWSLSEEKETSVWAIGSEKPHSLAYLPSSQSLIIGARQIFIYSVVTQKLLHAFVGQSSEVHLLKTIHVGAEDFIFSASKMERTLCLWKVTKKKSNNTPVGTLVMEDVSRFLSVSKDDAGIAKVTTVTRSGVIHVYLVKLKKIKTEKSIRPRITVQVNYDSNNTTNRIHAIAASVEVGNLCEDIFCGYGDSHFINFENIKLNFAEKVQILERKHPKDSLVAQQSTKDSLKRSMPIINPTEVDYRSASIAVRKSKQTTELPIESRLAGLDLDNGTTSNGPQPQSKAKLLTQALVSKDENLLRSVICTNDKKVIEITLSKLPVEHISALVNELTLMMEKKRYYVEFAICWLKILSHTHYSQLVAMGKENLLEKFGACIGIMNYRAKCLPDITKLDGRLQMLIDQWKHNSANEPSDELIYEDALVTVDSGSSSGGEDSLEENKDEQDENMVIDEEDE